MDEILLLALLVVFYVIAAPLFLFARLRRTERRVADLERALRPAGAAAAAPEPEPEPEAAPPAVAAEAPPQPVVSVPAPAEPAAAGPDLGPWVRTAEPMPARPARSFEERLTSRWMIWLGGLAVALSAVFLFRHAIDQGWLTPMTRVVAGILLGGALLSAGEWTLRRPVGAPGRTDYVPPALSAAGTFAIFAALYAAHALYGLLTAPTAFVALGLVSWAALGLALRQGWFVALLGLLAGYLVPALIATPDPQPGPVFLYLFLLTAGCLALRVWRRWWWFSWLALAGALLWPLLWVLDNRTGGDHGVVGAYVLGIAALFGALSTHLPPRQPEVPVLRWLWSTLRDTSGLGFAACGLLLVVLADAAGFDHRAFALVALYGAIAWALAMWRPGLQALFVVAAIVGLATAAAWPQPDAVTLPAEIARMGTGSAGTAFGPYVMPPEFAALARGLAVMAALFGLGGLAGLRRVRAPGAWAGVSAAMPVGLFALGYWRIGAFEIDVQWAMLAVGLSALLLAAAATVARWLDPGRRDLPLGLYAAGCTAALALAFACLLREAWLTVAIAAEVLALGWIWSRLRVAELRSLAALVVAVVIARLVLNEAVLEYSGSLAGIFGWVVYGYGLPALFIAVAARLLAAGGRDPAVTLCEIAAAGLAFLGVAAQLKLWTSGTLAMDRVGLFDQAVQSAWWISAAAMLLHDGTGRRWPWARPAGLVVLAAAAAQVFGGQVIENSPLAAAVPVGRVPVANLLGLAYLVPALAFLAIGGWPRFDIPALVRKALMGAAGVLAFVYITLEIRRAFRGTIIELRPDSMPADGEIYAYSAAWLGFALGLLAAGILRRSQALRHASLAVLVVTVAKVFLYDMSDLTGFYRIASFLGLGLVLIGIGRIYQRHVFGRLGG